MKNFEWKTACEYSVVLCNVPGCKENEEEINQQIKAIHMGWADWVFNF